MSDTDAILKCSTCLNDASTTAWIFGECLPVPAFGAMDAAKVQVATVGINPSSTEFYTRGILKPLKERLPASPDYGVTSRNQITVEHEKDATRRRAGYFDSETRRAHGWFVKLGMILNSANANWSYGNGRAVHLDIVACVTKQKWSDVDEIARNAMVKNCREHLEIMVNALPAGASLLFDGRTACETLAGAAREEWKSLRQFMDSNGQRQNLLVRRGIVTVGGKVKRFGAWNFTAKYLPDEVLPCIGESFAGEICQ